MASTESVLKLKKMTADQVFDYLRDVKPYTEEHDDVAEQLEDYMAKNPLECAKKFPAIYEYDYEMQAVFFEGIEYAALAGKKIDFEPFIKHIEDEKFDAERLDFDDSMWPVIRIIGDGLKGNAIDSKLKDRICRQILRIARCKGVENAKGYPKSYCDSRIITINDAGGKSFDTLFQYVKWSNDGDIPKTVREILEDYANNRDLYTIARHAAIGARLPLLHRLDSEFTGRLIEKITKLKRYKIAFWDAFATYNAPNVAILKSMPEWYNEFLNGKIAKDLHNTRFYLSNVQHVTVGYLRGVDGYEAIFDEFVNTASAKMINLCCWSVFSVLEEKGAIEFKDKLRRLWKDKRFIGNADLGKWFSSSPLEKKESIDLMLNYLKRRKAVAYVHAKDLDEYIDEYPIKAAQCLYYMIKKYEAPGSADIIAKQLERLLAKNDSGIAREFSRIEKLIKSLGYTVEYSKKTPYNVRIKRHKSKAAFDNN